MVNFLWLSLLISCIILKCCQSSTENSSNPVVTYGSAIVLRHQGTQFKLFSTKISWGAGSGQQIVTTVKAPDFDADCLWIVKHSHDAGLKITRPTLKPITNDLSVNETASPPPHGGSGVKCGDIVRLEHLTTHTNLHSHKHASAISPKNYEVSGYGKEGAGDPSDNFQIICLEKDVERWRFNTPIELYHLALDNFLISSSKSRFTQNNCPNCPIIGHQEVSVLSTKSKTNRDRQWIAEQGLIIEKLDDDDEEEQSVPHDEL